MSKQPSPRPKQKCPVVALSSSNSEEEEAGEQQAILQQLAVLNRTQGLSTGKVSLGKQVWESKQTN